MEKIIERLEKSFSFWFLLILSPVFFLLRIPSLVEPYWYGDEGIYEVLGLGVRNGRLLYEGVWDNKPPLLYLLYAIFNSDQFYLRLLSAIFGVLGAIAFFFLAKHLFRGAKSDKYAAYSTVIFSILFATPLLEGNIANAENFMLPLIVASAIIVFREFGLGYKNKLLLFISGGLLGISFLFKIVGIFDFAAFLLFIIFSQIESLRLKISLLFRKSITITKVIYPFVGGFLLPIIVTFLAFISLGILPEFIRAAFLHNFGYVGYGNQLIIPQGFLILKLILLFFAIIAIYKWRQKLGPSATFIFLWTAFSLFNLFFAQRPYTHYLLVFLPSFCLLITLIFWKKQIRPLTLTIFIVSLILIATNFRYYGKTFLYYQNFISFLIGKRSVFDYRNFFDRNTPHDYELSNYIKTHSVSSDTIFIWGNNAQVYALSEKLPPGRYTVAYHISSPDAISETQKDIRSKRPKLIIIMNNASAFPFSLMGYQEKIKTRNATIYEEII